MEKISLKNIKYEEIEIKNIEDSYNNTMDFEVENTHYYTLENGLVSHNTVSIMTQTTSGVEPVFLPVYKRRRKINPNDKNTKVDFVDENGDSWEEYKIFHHKFETWIKTIGLTVNEVKAMNDTQLDELVSRSPYFEATSADVNWVEKVKMQGSIQKWVDHSISVTVNLPKDATEETVEQVYLSAWESGCFTKGHSIYTSDGIKDISNISIGDIIINDDGIEDVVDDVYDLSIQKRNFVSIKASGMEEINCTIEHPILVMEMNNDDIRKSFSERNKKLTWKKAGEITTNDHIMTPKNINISNQINKLNFSDYIKTNNIIEDENIFLSGTLPWKSDKFVKSAKSNHFKNSIIIDDEFCNFLGWFIAEGHFASTSCIRLNFNLNENLECERLSKFIENEFNLKTSSYITTGNDGQSLRLEFHSKLLSEFLEIVVGRKSINKHLPIFYTNLSKHNLSVLLDSYYKGDGGTTVSKRLARELFMANLMINDRPYFKPDYATTFFVGKSKSNTSFKTAKPYDNFLCYKVNKVNFYESDEKVYNFSVSNNDTYIVNGVIVHNCKGITVYRDGSRSGVLISDKKEDKSVEQIIKENNAPKRPKLVECEILRFQNNREKWIGFVGLLGGKPYEIFTGLLESFQVPTFVEKGWIKKTKDKDGKSSYDLVYYDKDGIEQELRGLSRAFNREYWNTGKLLSGILRHGMPLPNVMNLIDSLNTVDGDNITSWKSGVKRMLKKYIKDDVLVSGQTCPNCGGHKLKNESGCCVCADCGWSKCS